MRSRSLLKSIFLVVAIVATACTTAAPPAAPTSAPEPTNPPEATATTAPTATAVPATETVAPTAESAGPVIGSDNMLEPRKLFVDDSGACTKKVTMSFMEHGDWLDPNVDQRYGMGLLIKRWQEAQSCVELKIVPVPPGDAPGFADSQLIAGTPNDIFSTHPKTTWYDNKWVVQLDDYLNAKNPYSENATWYEDFPYADITQPPYTADGHYYNIALGIHTGAVAPDGIVYNADLLKAAGVDVDKEIPPKTMTEFFAILKKVKDSGKIPFWLSLAGDTRWEIDWYGRFLLDQLMPDVAAAMDKAVDDNDDKWGTLSEMEYTYGVLKGIFKSTDERVGEYFRIMKDWSQYWEPGYAAPPELVAETAAEFLKGNVAMTTVGSWRIATIQNYPDRGFEWGTFFMPPIDKDFSKFATGEPIRRHGGNGQPAGPQLVPAYIASQVQKDPDKLAAAIDLLQYVSAPQSIVFYCSQLLIPCYEPGASLDEIFKGDKVAEQRLRAFFDPAPVDIPVLGVYHSLYTMQGGSDEVTRLMVEYMQDNITLDVLQQRVQEGMIAGATDSCATKLKDKVEGWDWCSEYAK